MPGRHLVRAIRGEAAAQQLVELDVLVAGLAGIGRGALQVGIGEGINHARAKGILDVEDEERDTQDLRNPTAIVGGVRRAARALRLPALAREWMRAHPNPDDFVGGLCVRSVRGDAGHHRGGDARVDSSAHGGHDPAHAPDHSRARLPRPMAPRTSRPAPAPARPSLLPRAAARHSA